MRARPSYIAPCPGPKESGRNHSMLHALRTGAGLAFDTVTSLERDARAWRSLPETDRDAAAKAAGIDAENLEMAIESMAAALPQAEPPKTKKTSKPKD